MLVITNNGGDDVYQVIARCEDLGFKVRAREGRHPADSVAGLSDPEGTAVSVDRLSVEGGPWLHRLEGVRGSRLGVALRSKEGKKSRSQLVELHGDRVSQSDLFEDWRRNDGLEIQLDKPCTEPNL